MFWDTNPKLPMSNLCMDCEEPISDPEDVDLCLDCYSAREMEEMQAWYLVDTAMECHCSGCLSDHDPWLCPHRLT